MKHERYKRVLIFRARFLMFCHFACSLPHNKNPLPSPEERKSLLDPHMCISHTHPKSKISVDLNIDRPSNG